MIIHRLSLKNVALLLNILYASGICLLLFLAFFMQFYFQEPPCPLCLLQRIGFILTAMGFLFNIRFGIHPSHYAISLLGALYTSFVALRQIALHVIPGSGSYGASIFGLHMYSWSFIISMLIIIATAFLLGLDPSYETTDKQPKTFRTLGHFTFVVMFILITSNFIATVLECGFSSCPENPLGYRL